LRYFSAKRTLPARGGHPVSSRFEMANRYYLPNLIETANHHHEITRLLDFGFDMAHPINASGARFDIRLGAQF